MSAVISVIEKVSKVQSYWKKRRVEYLCMLQVRHNWCNQDHPIKLGTVVFTGDENVPPLYWPLGIITNVYSGSDNVVRVAMIKTTNGSFKHPVVKLHPLPS